MSQRAYVNGFIKRAAVYGISASDAFDLLKYAYDPNYHDGPGGSVFAPRRPLGQSDKSLAIAGTQTYAGPGGSVFAPRKPLGQSAESLANAGTQTYAGPGGSVFAPRQPMGPSNRSLATAGTQNLQGPGSSALSAIMNAGPQQSPSPNTATPPAPAKPSAPVIQPPTLASVPQPQAVSRAKTLRGGSISFPTVAP